MGSNSKIRRAHSLQSLSNYSEAIRFECLNFERGEIGILSFEDFSIANRVELKIRLSQSLNGSCAFDRSIVTKNRGGYLLFE